MALLDTVTPYRLNTARRDCVSLALAPSARNATLLYGIRQGPCTGICGVQIPHSNLCGKVKLGVKLCLTY